MNLIRLFVDDEVATIFNLLDNHTLCASGPQGGGDDVVHLPRRVVATLIARSNPPFIRRSVTCSCSCSAAKSDLELRSHGGGGRNNRQMRGGVIAGACLFGMLV